MPEETAAQQSRLLRPQAAWEYLDISKAKLYELTRMGKIAYVQLPGSSRNGKGRGDRRYELSELERFIDEHRVG